MNTTSCQALTFLWRSLFVIFMLPWTIKFVFDVVNIKLLLKRLTLFGLPRDILRLIKLWLMNRSFYVNIIGITSIAIDLRCGPNLYMLFFAPPFDQIDLTNFADDNLIKQWNRCTESLIGYLEKYLEAMI